MINRYLLSPGQTICQIIVSALFALMTLPVAASIAPPIEGLVNVARNASVAQGTSIGWGGGNHPEDLFDGEVSYSSWARGLAFTGGQKNWSGTCGERQLIVNLGSIRRISAARIWHHGEEHIPEVTSLHALIGPSWNNVGGTVRVRSDLDSTISIPSNYGSIPTEYDTATTIVSWQLATDGFTRLKFLDSQTVQRFETISIMKNWTQPGGL